MEMDGGAGAARVFPRYAPKEGATCCRSQTNEGDQNSGPKGARMRMLTRALARSPTALD